MTSALPAPTHVTPIQAMAPPGNDLLASLPADELAALAPAIEPVSLRLGDMLYEPGGQLRHAYFPCTAVVSLHYVTESGASAETAGVGHEGVVGIALFMGGATTTSSAVVHTGGTALRIERHALVQAFEAGPSLRRALLRYAQALMTQTAQTAACYRHHSVEQQLSGWLMATQDRRQARAPAALSELAMTQELLASLLGVRRESITQAAGQLQARGFIRYRRGHIAVLDPAGLRRQACECYGVLKTELRRLAPRNP